MILSLFLNILYKLIHARLENIAVYKLCVSSKETHAVYRRKSSLRNCVVSELIWTNKHQFWTRKIRSPLTSDDFTLMFLVSSAVGLEFCDGLGHE